MVAGNASGTIEKCFTSGTIMCNLKGDGGCNIGGMLGYTTGKVEECGSNVNVDITSEGKMIGGSRISSCIGDIEPSGYVRNIYDKGNCKVSGDGMFQLLCGGLIGSCAGDTSGGYSVGNCSLEGGFSSAYICYMGVLVGDERGTQPKNVFYPGTMTFETNGFKNVQLSENGKYDGELTSDDVLTALNSEKPGVWKKDPKTGYPIFSWQ